MTPERDDCRVLSAEASLVLQRTDQQSALVEVGLFSSM
jgi:hypothetical protein